MPHQFFWWRARGGGQGTPRDTGYQTLSGYGKAKGEVSRSLWRLASRVLGRCRNGRCCFEGKVWLAGCSPSMHWAAAAVLARARPRWGSDCAELYWGRARAAAAALQGSCALLHGWTSSTTALPKCLLRVLMRGRTAHKGVSTAAATLQGLGRRLPQSHMCTGVSLPLVLALHKVRRLH